MFEPATVMHNRSFFAAVKNVTTGEIKRAPHTIAEDGYLYETNALAYARAVAGNMTFQRFATL